MTEPNPPATDVPLIHQIGRVAAVLLTLYAFLVGVKGLEAGIGAFGSSVTEGIFDGVTNPIAGLCAGILATVLVQSSSVTTSTIVSLVGAGVLSVTAAVPIVMGSNIGTTVTNTLVSLGHVRQGLPFRRAFAGATVHDFFNVLTVLVVLPLELLTGFLSNSAALLTRVFRGGENVAGFTTDSALSVAMEWPIKLLHDSIAASSSIVQGTVLVTISLGLVFGALTIITKSMRLLMAGRIERSMNRMLDRGAGLGAMGMGLLITVLVQSSSITTSIMIPMMAAGVLTLRNAYPVALGANVGTTITALLAAMAVTAPEALTIALVHTLFNVAGILLFYPIPAMRAIPLRLASALAGFAQDKARWALAYVLGAFVLLPLIGLLVLA